MRLDARGSGGAATIDDFVSRGAALDPDEVTIDPSGRERSRFRASDRQAMVDATLGNRCDEEGLGEYQSSPRASNLGDVHAVHLARNA